MSWITFRHIQKSSKLFLFPAADPWRYPKQPLSTNRPTSGKQEKMPDMISFGLHVYLPVLLGIWTLFALMRRPWYTTMRNKARIRLLCRFSLLCSSLPTGTTIEGPSKLDVLSDTIMDRSALNEVNGHDSETEGTNLSIGWK